MCKSRKSEAYPINIDERFEMDLAAVTSKFDEDVDMYIAGIPPEGGIYRLGNPGEILLSAGIEDLPVTLWADRLSDKASPEYKNNHPFSLSDVKGLPKAINYPIAVFDNATNGKSKVILTDLQDKKGNNFVVALKNRAVGAGGKKGSPSTNEILTIFPKNKAVSILEWIVSRNNSLRYVNKEKALNFISSQPTNPTVGGDKAQGISPKLIESAKNKVEGFQNPTC